MMQYTEETKQELIKRVNDGLEASAIICRAVEHCHLCPLIKTCDKMFHIAPGNSDY